MKKIRNKAFGLDELKLEIHNLAYVLSRQANESEDLKNGTLPQGQTGGRFNSLPESLLAVEEDYVPLRGGFLDQNKNVTYTNMEMESAYLIASLCALYRPKNVLETGTHEGYSAAHMARAMHALGIDGHIHTFDPFMVAHRFENNDLQQYVTWINDFSTNHMNYNLPNEFDFMLLDSDHTYKTLATEVNIFEPLLKVGGLLIMHDTVVFKDLWPVVDAITATGRFEILNLDTPRDWGHATGLNGSGLTICKKIGTGQPIPVQEKYFNNNNVDDYIAGLSEERRAKAKRSMFFNNG